MEVAHIDAWRRDPDRFWGFYAERFASLRDKQPNPAHEALAELERRGLIRGVITQNVDRLHRLAGTQRLVEVHGSIESSICLECRGRVPLERVVRMIAEAGGGAPECEACLMPLKPDVVLFGEMLPDDAIQEAHTLALEADLILCVGSSLEVYPVAGLTLETLAAGGSLAIVNRGATPFDERAAVTIDAGAGETLRALVDALPERA
jgi:NAD-dependent deacetylase